MAKQQKAAKQEELFIKSITEARTLNHTQYETAKTVLSTDPSNKCNSKLFNFTGTLCLFGGDRSMAAGNADRGIISAAALLSSVLSLYTILIGPGMTIVIGQ